MNEELREKVAEKLAETIFNLGYAPNSPCERLQFMGGKYPDKEKGQGGLCKHALMAVIRDNLDITLIRTATLDEVRDEVEDEMHVDYPSFDSLLMKIENLRGSDE